MPYDYAGDAEHRSMPLRPKDIEELEAMDPTPRPGPNVQGDGDPELHRYWVERERYEEMVASRNWWRTFAFIVLGSNLLREVVTFFNR